MCKANATLIQHAIVLRDGGIILPLLHQYFNSKMDYHHRHNESIVFRSPTKSNTEQYSPSDHHIHYIRIRYITDAGERRIRKYSISAFSSDGARRKAGDLFRREFPKLRKQ